MTTPKPSPTTTTLPPPSSTPTANTPLPTNHSTQIRDIATSPSARPHIPSRITPRHEEGTRCDPSKLLQQAKTSPNADKLQSNRLLPSQEQLTRKGTYGGYAPPVFGPKLSSQRVAQFKMANPKRRSRSCAPLRLERTSTTPDPPPPYPVIDHEGAPEQPYNPSPSSPPLPARPTTPTTKLLGHLNDEVRHGESDCSEPLRRDPSSKNNAPGKTNVYSIDLGRAAKEEENQPHSHHPKEHSYIRPGHEDRNISSRAPQRAAPSAPNQT